VEARLRALVTDHLGADFFDTWYKVRPSPFYPPLPHRAPPYWDFFDTWYQGLPDPYSNSEGVAVGYLYWLWYLVKVRFRALFVALST
jgi:hypothetical protein